MDNEMKPIPQYHLSVNKYWISKMMKKGLLITNIIQSQIMPIPMKFSLKLMAFIELTIKV